VYVDYCSVSFASVASVVKGKTVGLSEYKIPGIKTLIFD